jgi:ribonuclease HII
MISGVDEAGRGPCIGPLVIAGVTLSNDTELKALHIRDSKQITPKRRNYLADKIKKIASKYRIVIIPAADIDVMRKTMTLNDIEVYAFSKIIDELKAETCYVDAADVNDQRFGNNILSHLSYTPTIISRHKADERYPIVGAASILAKTTRDREVQNIERELQEKLSIPMGSGYPADPITQQFLIKWLNQYGDLPPYARRSWKTCEKLVNQRKLRSLDDF